MTNIRRGNPDMMTKYVMLVAAGAVSSLVSGVALAGDNWPASVVGTWHGQADQSVVTITITNQAATGRCRPISGTFVDVTFGTTSNILGFYCPATGRFNFVRNETTTGLTFQDYSGNVSDKGSTLFMGGVFADVIGAGNVGEYSFLAEK
jgi:hypothetical protein